MDADHWKDPAVPPGLLAPDGPDHVDRAGGWPAAKPAAKVQAEPVCRRVLHGAPGPGFDLVLPARWRRWYGPSAGTAEPSPGHRPRLRWVGRGSERPGSA